MNFSNLRQRNLVFSLSKILLICLGLLFLGQHVQYLRRIIAHIRTTHYSQLFSPQPDLAMRVESQLQSIRAMKLNPAMRMQYIGDKKFYTKDEYTRDYFLARYTLAPLKLNFHHEHDTVVCNFPWSLNIKNPMNPLSGSDRWVIISDNGKGALVLVKKEKP